MVGQSNNNGAVGLDLSNTVKSRILRSCPPSRPLAKLPVSSYLLRMSRGTRIVKALLEKGVTKREIQRHCGVDYKTVIAWANDWWKPSMENVGRLQSLYIKHQNFPFGQLELNLEDYTR